MIGYVTLGTGDLKRGAAFYDKVLELLGAKRTMESEKFIGWSTGEGAMVGLTKPWDGNAPTIGNGVMIALEAPSAEVVNRIHAMAVSLGGKDEGAPGDRGGGFYAGYFRDLDGNKLNAFFWGSQD